MNLPTHKQHNRSCHQAIVRLLAAKEIRQSTDPETVELVEHCRAIITRDRVDTQTVSLPLLALLTFAALVSAANLLAFFAR